MSVTFENVSGVDLDVTVDGRSLHVTAGATFDVPVDLAGAYRDQPVFVEAPTDPAAAAAALIAANANAAALVAETAAANDEAAALAAEDVALNTTAKSTPTQGAN